MKKTEWEARKRAFNAIQEDENFETIGVHVQLTKGQVEALRAEAFRRVQAGEARRMDVSALIREAIEQWRTGLSASSSSARPAPFSAEEDYS